MMSLIRYGLVAMLLLGGLSCDAPTEPLPLTSPNGETPIVTGYRINSLRGPETIEEWGVPNEASDVAGASGAALPGGQDIETVITDVIPHGFELLPVYPIPAPTDLVIVVRLPYAAPVSLWIVPADLPTGYFSAQIRYPGLSIKTLFREKTLQAGTYQFTWDGNDDAGRRVPAGPYRVYFQAGGGIAWRNALLHIEGDGVPTLVKRMLTK